MVGAVGHRATLLGAGGRRRPGRQCRQRARAFMSAASFPTRRRACACSSASRRRSPSRPSSGSTSAANSERITHLLITCCTGFSAPGLDFELVERCNLPTSVERTMIGFMGCYAAINALKLARHIVRSEPASRVLVAQSRTLHAASSGNHQARAASVVSAVRRRLRGSARHRGAGRDRARQLPRRAGAEHQRA